MLSSEKTAMEYTGERMVPESAQSEAFWEHIYRYRFARRYVLGKRVLDIACGEGYGSFSLVKAGASSVIGVDISQDACEHARRKYQVDARCGSAMDIPLASGAVDVVVSFETVEHVDQPAIFVKECARVLDPRGMLIISTPNQLTYSETGSHNQFHCSEMTEPQFLSLLSPHFASVTLYSQSVKTAPMWSLRSLGAVETPWRNVRGYWRVRQMLEKSGTWSRSDHDFRQHPEKAIAEDDNMWSQLVSPYQVRPRSHFSRERPLYFVAVCKPKQQPSAR